MGAYGQKNNRIRRDGHGPERKRRFEPMTARGLYDWQNKLMHRAFSAMCMPYKDNRMYFRAAWSQEFGREVKGMSDLNLGERSRVLNGFSMKGIKIYTPFVPRHWMEWRKDDPEPKGTINQRPMHVPRGKAGMVSKIHAILADMKLPWSYVDDIARKRFRVEFVEWLQAEDLRSVVQMMVMHQKRHGGPGVMDREKE